MRPCALNRPKKSALRPRKPLPPARRPIRILVRRLTPQKRAANPNKNRVAPFTSWRRTNPSHRVPPRAGTPPTARLPTVWPQARRPPQCFAPWKSSMGSQTAVPPKCWKAYPRAIRSSLASPSPRRNRSAFSIRSLSIANESRQPPPPRGRPVGTTADALMSAVIQLEEVSKVYDSEGLAVQALDRVSFQIMAGEFVALMGSSGSGKSTLMNILGCLDRPTEGRYLLGGVDVSRSEEHTSEL